MQQIKLDSYGLAVVWDITAKRWRSMPPIDAKDGLRSGAFSVDGPEDEAPKKPSVAEKAAARSRPKPEPKVDPAPFSDEPAAPQE